MASELPPIYSPEDTNYPASSDDGEQLHSSATAVLDSSLQLLISPSSLDTLGFQNGFVGAEGEHAAIEGEVQIKSLSGHWQKVTVSLRSVETAYGHDEIVLADTTQVLFESPPPADHSSTGGGGVSTVPSTLPFAIPLPDDTPQCVHTAKSSLTYTLTAALYAADATVTNQATTATAGAAPVVHKSFVIHPKRYRSHASTIAIAPQTHVLASPTRVEIQVPRTTFSSDESIPIYVTVPPPSREVVVDRGLRIRNVRAELFRVVRIRRSSAEQEYSSGSSSSDEEEDEEDDKSEHGLQVPLSHRTIPPDSASSPSTSKAPILPAHDYPSNNYWSTNSDSYRTIISRSGGSCRFHSTRPLRLRFVLHPPSPDDSPSTFQMNVGPTSSEGTLASTGIQYVEGDIRCASITQATLLHSVRFGIKVGVSFVDTTNRREVTHWVHIPVTLVAPAAPLPEVDADIDAAYQKKHDRPPAQTVRMPEEDAESSAPHYYNHYFEQGQAGPSAFGFPGAGEGPPPFDDDREAPPPFFEGSSSSAVAAAAAAAGTVVVATTNQSNNTHGNHLPTFQESEHEIFIPVEEDEQGLLDAAAVSSIEGEGTLFGFPVSEQFDGQIVNDDVYRATTPPPTLEQATLDTDVTELATIQEPARAMEALSMVLEQQQQQHDEVLSSSSGMGPDDEPPPPPPPAMDDPSDPPPSIDSEFRSPIGGGGGGSSSGGLISVERHSPPSLAHHHDNPPPPLSPLPPSPLLPPPLPPHHRHHHGRPPSFSEGSLAHSLTDSSLPSPPLPPPPDGVDPRMHRTASGGMIVVPTTGHAPPPYLVQGEDGNGNHGHGHGQVPVQSRGGARTGSFSMSMRAASASHAHDSHAAAEIQIQNNNSHPPPYVDHLPPPPLPPPPPSHR